MQTKELYYDDINLLNFEANIVDIIEKNNEYHVVLDQTAFYPDGGGMSSDKGMIDNIKVENVIRKDGIIYHILKEKPTNQKIHGCVDAKIRIKQIQIHDAQHILSALFEKNYNLITTSHHVADDYCDLILDNGELTEEIMMETEALANQLIFEQKKLDIFLLAKADLKKYNIQDNPKYTDPVRITNIETVDDYNACGCLHFDNLAKIQAIKCFKIEKTGSQYRVIFSAGSALLDYIEKTNRNYDYSKTIFKANDDNYVNMVDTLMNKNRDTLKELEDIKHRFYANEVAQLAQTNDFFIYELPSENSQDLKIVSNQIVNFDKPIYALLQVEKDGKFQFNLVKQKDCSVNLEELFTQLKNDITIHGGGKGLSITGQSQTNLVEIIENYL